MFETSAKQLKRNFKTFIPSSKKYFLWEFVLNGKYHKIELFHSKVSGKKKLALDAQTIQEHKGYSNDFTYSFKVDKNYFNVVQIASDKYEMRIDNRTFETLMQEERSKGFHSKKEEEVENVKEVVSKKSFDPAIQKHNSMAFPSTLKTGGVKTNPRNENSDFFDDKDFDFNKGSVNNNLRNTTQYSKGPQSNQSSQKAKTENILIDMHSIVKEKEVVSKKADLTEINFQVTENDKDIYKHNQQILNNLNIMDDSSEDELPQFGSSNNVGGFSQLDPTSNNVNNLNQNQFQQLQQQQQYSPNVKNNYQPMNNNQQFGVMNMSGNNFNQNPNFSGNNFNQNSNNLNMQQQNQFSGMMSSSGNNFNSNFPTQGNNNFNSLNYNHNNNNNNNNNFNNQVSPNTRYSNNMVTSNNDFNLNQTQSTSNTNQENELKVLI
jgi:hypothetical protein